MKLARIKGHLAPYRIHAKRATTVNHAFSSALAPAEPWNEERATDAMRTLGQADMAALTCVYCDQPAQTWDHLEPMVRNSLPTGFGHTLGNLVPSCRDCNSSKGNKPWRQWIVTWPKMSEDQRAQLTAYAEAFTPPRKGITDWESQFPEHMQRLREHWDAVLHHMKQADAVIDEMRSRTI